MDKGFGFIQGERGELFFHHSALDGVTIEELREGQQVEFEEGRGPKGPRAENVKARLSFDLSPKISTDQAPGESTLWGLFFARRVMHGPLTSGRGETRMGDRRSAHCRDFASRHGHPSPSHPSPPSSPPSLSKLLSVVASRQNLTYQSRRYKPNNQECL